MTPVHLGLIALIDVLWAFNIVAVKIVVDAAQPITGTALRYIIVLAACLPWMRWLPARMPLVMLTGVIAGALFLGLGGLSFAAATNVSALAIAGQLGVPFSLILAVIFYHERIRWIRITGIVLSFAGVGVMAFDPRILDERLGLLLTVGASLCWATGNLLFRKLKGAHALNLQGWLAVVSVPILLGLSLVFEPGALAHVPSLSALVWSWIAYSAIGSSIIGHGGMAYLFQRYPVSTVAPLTLPTPLLSVAIGSLVFHTPVTVPMIVGGLLTLAGIAIITLRTSKARE